MATNRGRLDGEGLRRCLAAGRLTWRRHALERMLARGLSRQDVIAVLRMDEQIETYPDDFPFPSALFAGTILGRMIHVVAGFDARSREVYVISAYEPDAEHFEVDGRTRKRRPS